MNRPASRQLGARVAIVLTGLLLLAQPGNLRAQTATGGTISAPATAVADGSPVTITITADQADGFDNIDLDVTPPGTPSDPTNFVHIGGNDYTTEISATTTGTSNISGTINTFQLTGTSVQFVPGPPSGSQTQITANPTSIPANGTSTSTITVQARDANGNDITSGGATVTLNTTAGSFTTGITDNGNGTYSRTLQSSTTVTTATITGTINAQAITDNATVSFTALVPSGAQTLITAVPTSITANGSSTSTITVQARDAGGTNITTGGATVTLNTTAGTFTGPVVDNNDGTYTRTLQSSTTVTTATITGTIDSQTITDNATVQFTAGPPSGAQSQITANPTSITANGTSTSTITVQARDANGNTITTGGATVTLSTDQGTLLGTVQDQGNGTYTQSLRSSTTPTTATITGQINSQTISDNATVQFTAGTPSGATTLITANPTSIPANGTSTSTITVQARDAAGNNITSGGATVTLNTTAGTFITAVVDNGNGTYTRTLQSSTASGTATITGTINASSITDNAIVQFTPATPSGATSTISAAPGSIPANGTSTSTITVQLRDASGANITTGGHTVTLATTAGTFTTPVVDNGNGTYTRTLQSSTSSGTANISGTVNGSPITDGAAVVFTAATPSGATTTITASPTSITANGTSTSTITVQAKDASGANLTTGGATVTLSSTAGTFIGAVVDNGNGTYTRTLRSPTTPGQAIVTGTINTQAISDDATVQFTVGPPAGSTTQITASPTAIAADGTSTSTITVQARDANNNVISTGGSIVVINTTAGTFTGPVVDNGNGTYSRTLRSSTTVQTATITGTIGGQAITDNATVDFVPGSANRLNFFVEPSNVASGAAIAPPVQVEVIDANNNRVTGFNSQITLSIANNPAGGVLSGTTAVNAVSGLATFGNLRIDKAGTGYTLTASASGLAGDNSAAFNVTPGAPSGATSTIDAAPTSIPANGTSASTVTVTLRDAAGNPLTAGGATVALATTRGTLGAVTDNGNGTYRATLTSSTASGPATISGTVNGSAITDNAIVNFTATSADRLVFQVEPSNTGAGAPIVPAVVVRALDATGNTVTTFNGTVTMAIGANPGGGTLSGTTTVQAASGVATFNNLRIDRTGVGYTLVASAAGLQSATSAGFRITAGAASPATTTITATPGAIIADGTSTSTITVQLKDAAGNNLTSGSATVALSTTAGTLGPVSNLANGTFRATLTSSAIPATATITGTLNGAAIADNEIVLFTTNQGGLADLAVVVSADVTTQSVGDTVVYTVTVTNSGPQAATGVQITATLPARLQIVSSTPSQGTFNAGTRIWAVGALALSASATLTVTTVVN